MKTKLVSYTLETPPPLTDKQRANLKALAARPDSEINYGDIPPPMTDEQLKNAVRGRFLQTGQTADHGARGCRRAGMAQVAGEGLSIPHQCHSAAGNAGLAQGVSATTPPAYRGNALQRATAWLIFSPSGPMPERRHTAIMGVIALRRIPPTASCWSEVSVTGSSTCSTNAPRAMTDPSRRSIANPSIGVAAGAGDRSGRFPRCPCGLEQALDLSVALRVSVHGSLHVTLAEARGS